MLGVQRVAELCHLAKVWQMSDTEAEVQVVTLAEELQDLVGWPTPPKVASLPTLRSLKSVRQQLPSDPFPNAIAAVVWSEIRAAMRDLAGEYSFTYSNKTVTVSAEQARRGYSWLLSLSGETGTARERRQECIDALGLTGRVSVSTWRREPELNFIKTLSRELIQRSQSSPRAGRRISVDEAEDTYYLNSRGVLVKAAYLYTIRALQDGITSVHETWYASDRRGPEAIRIGATFNCRILRQDYIDDDPAILDADIGLPMLNRGDKPLTYAYELHYDPEAPDQGSIRYSPTSKHKRYMVTVRFDPMRMPRHVWFFDRVHHLRVPTRPTPDTVIKPRRPGVYDREFSDLEPGWCYGLGWEWSTQLPR